MSKTKTAIMPEEKKVLRKMYWAMFLQGVTFTMTKMTANGVTIVMNAALDQVYRDDPEGRKEALVRHNQFYNCHSVVTCFIAGLCYALEKEKVEKGSVTGETIQNIKVSLMGPGAGIGDALFFNCLRVIAAGIGIGLCATGNILGAVLFVLLYAGVQLICRWYMLRAGFTMGTSFIEKMFESGLVDALTKAASILGIIVIGSMVPAVSVALNWTINISGASVVVADVLNSIMPNLLSVGVVLGMMVLIRKGVKSTKIVIGVLLGSIVLAALGIF